MDNIKIIDEANRSESDHLKKFTAEKTSLEKRLQME